MLMKSNGPEKALANSAKRPTMNVKALTNPSSGIRRTRRRRSSRTLSCNCRRDPRRDAVDEQQGQLGNDLQERLEGMNR